MGLVEALSCGPVRQLVGFFWSWDAVRISPPRVRILDDGA